MKSAAAAKGPTGNMTQPLFSAQPKADTVSQGCKTPSTAAKQHSNAAIAVGREWTCKGTRVGSNAPGKRYTRPSRCYPCYPWHKA